VGESFNAGACRRGERALQAHPAPPNAENPEADLRRRGTSSPFRSRRSRFARRRPIDVLKIDRSFVARLDTDRAARGVVSAILGLAASLGLRVVAEGVETEQQLDMLRGNGCHEAQGYLLARPETADGFRKSFAPQPLARERAAPGPSGVNCLAHSGGDASNTSTA
jgi:hypothetical protein